MSRQSPPPPPACYHKSCIHCYYDYHTQIKPYVLRKCSSSARPPSHGALCRQRNAAPHAHLTRRYIDRVTGPVHVHMTAAATQSPGLHIICKLGEAMHMRICITLDHLTKTRKRWKGGWGEAGVSALSSVAAQFSQDRSLSSTALMSPRSTTSADSSALPSYHHEWRKKRAP
jgi:hypothetical protein